jgi:hypothetical protein
MTRFMTIFASVSLAAAFMPMAANATIATPLSQVQIVAHKAISGPLPEVQHVAATAMHGRMDQAIVQSGPAHLLYPESVGG